MPRVSSWQRTIPALPVSKLEKLEPPEARPYNFCHPEARFLRRRISLSSALAGPKPERQRRRSGGTCFSPTQARVRAERTPPPAAFDLDLDVDLEIQMGPRKHRGRAALKRRVKHPIRNAASAAEAPTPRGSRREIPARATTAESHPSQTTREGTPRPGQGSQ